MHYTDKQCLDIIQAYVNIKHGKCSKLSAFKDLEDKKVKVKQANFYKLLAHLQVLDLLLECNVEEQVINKVAEQMKIYYIWKIYMEMKKQ